MHALALLAAEAAGVTVGVVIGGTAVVLTVRWLSRRHKAQEARGKYKPRRPEFIEAVLR